MGPQGGDELNLIEKGVNYGYPLVSDGNHYDDTPLPDHSTRPEFRKPVFSWTPVISPAGFIIFDGDLFPQWRTSVYICCNSSISTLQLYIDDTTVHTD